LRALQVAPVNQDVQITSDSKYTINCASVWYKNWERNGWRSSKGDAVLNQDLIKAIRAKIEERNGQKAKTIFKWVKGHAKDPGNIAADALAVMAAKGL
jgi:ribonuclease HI